MCRYNERVMREEIRGLLAKEWQVYLAAAPLVFLRCASYQRGPVGDTVGLISIGNGGDKVAEKSRGSVQMGLEGIPYLGGTVCLRWIENVIDVIEEFCDW